MLALGGEPRWSLSAPVTCAAAARMQPPWQTTSHGPPAAISSSSAPDTRCANASHGSPSGAVRGPPRQFVSSLPCASISAAVLPPHSPTSISRQRGSNRPGCSPISSAVSRARPRSLHTTRSPGTPSTHPGQRARLLAPALGQRRVELPLQALLGVPGGLAVADEDQAVGR